MSRQSRGINKLLHPSHSGAGACAEMEFNAFFLSKNVAGSGRAAYAFPGIIRGLQPEAGKVTTTEYFIWHRLDLSVWVVT